MLKTPPNPLSSPNGMPAKLDHRTVMASIILSGLLSRADSSSRPHETIIKQAVSDAKSLCKELGYEW
jgi:hypothetical protein